MRPEDRLQSRARMLLNSHLPAPCHWSSVGHERKQTMRQGQMQKARGVKRGLPDIMIWAPGYFLGVELKAGKNTATPEQAAFGQAMARLQFGYEVVRSVEQLGEVLERHGIALAPGWRVAAMHHDAALDVHQRGHNKPTRARAAKPTARAMAKLAKARAETMF